MDEALLFGSDSDDSFAKDYTITRDTMRRERIVHRDKAVFKKEKKQREEDRLYKMEINKLEANELKKSQAEAELRATEEAI